MQSIHAGTSRAEAAWLPSRLLLAGIILCGGGWHSQPARADQPPVTQSSPVIGEVSTYTPKFMTLNCTQWTLAALGQNGFAVSKCNGYTAYASMANGALVRITDAGGNDVVRFTPFQPGIQFPLTIGKTWTASYAGYLQFADTNWNSNETCKVADYETVQVPAGPMPSFRVQCHEAWTSGPYSGTSDTTSWYAPQVHGVVKVDSPSNQKWNMQLVSYKP